MLNRREFVTLTGAAAMSATLAQPSNTANADSHARDYYEYRQYTFSTDTQIKAFHAS